MYGAAPVVDPESIVHETRDPAIPEHQAVKRVGLAACILLAASCVVLLASGSHRGVFALANPTSALGATDAADTAYPVPAPSLLPESLFPTSAAPTRVPAPIPTVAPGDPSPPPTHKPSPAPTHKPTKPAPTVAPSAGVNTFCSEPGDMTQDDTYYTDTSWVFGETSDDGTDCLATGVMDGIASGFLYDENSENYADTTSTLTFYAKEFLKFNAFAINARASSTTPYYGSYAKVYGYGCRIYTLTSGQVYLTIADSGSNLETDSTQTLDLNTWYKLELIVEGETITCSMYDVDSGSSLATLTTTDDDLTSGYNGISVFQTSSADFEIMFGEMTVSHDVAPTSAPTSVSDYTFCSASDSLNEAYSGTVTYNYNQSYNSADCLLTITADATDSTGLLVTDSQYEDSTTTMTFTSSDWDGMGSGAVGLMARAPSTDPISDDIWFRNYGYNCRFYFTSSVMAVSIVTTSSTGSNTYVDVDKTDNDGTTYVDGGDYTMTFTVEGTSLSCTITDDTGTTLSSVSGTSSLFDSGYSAIGVYSDDAQTVEVYLSDYNIDGDTV